MSDSPTVGSTYVDDTGCTLLVTDVQPHSKLDRHVVGLVNAKPYACSFQTFAVIWAARPVREEIHPPLVEDSKPRTQLYDGTRALPYTRRS